MTGVTPDSSTRPPLPGRDLSSPSSAPLPSPSAGSRSATHTETRRDETEECWQLLQVGDRTAVPAPVEHAGLSGAGLATADVVAPLVRQSRHTDPDATPPGRQATRRVAEVCHDMRQPLTTIQYLVEGALDGSRSPLIRRNLSRISAQVDYLVALTEQLLTESAVVWERVDVRALLRAVAATVHGESGKNSVRMKLVTPDGEDVVISADRVGLKRAVVNLVENAIRVAGPGGEVWISVSRHPGTVAICVEDTGPGLDGAGNARPALGLLITEQVARMHGGRVEVTGSEHLGGAAFRLLLPDPRS